MVITRCVSSGPELEGADYLVSLEPGGMFEHHWLDVTVEQISNDSNLGVSSVTVDKL